MLPRRGHLFAAREQPLRCVLLSDRAYHLRVGAAPARRRQAPQTPSSSGSRSLLPPSARSKASCPRLRHYGACHGETTRCVARRAPDRPTRLAAFVALRGISARAVARSWPPQRGVRHCGGCHGETSRCVAARPRAWGWPRSVPEGTLTRPVDRRARKGPRRELR